MKILFCLRVLCILGLFVTSGCFMHVVHYDGEYRGKVIDVDTGEPIEGVVVLGIWNTVHASPGGGVSYYYDARETVTDKNGDFLIPGMGLRVLSRLAPMDVLIFKAGYRDTGGPWTSLKSHKEFKWEGEKAIIPLKKLTMDQRVRRGDPPYPPTEAQITKKAQRYMEEIDRDRRERGLKGIKLF